jgi:hypothetical protein
MTGEDLYRLWEEAHAAENCGVDSWEELDEMTRRVWNAMATRLSE